MYMPFIKEDLICTHYHTDENEQSFTGQPSRRSFDRFNSSQVLFIINFYGSLSDRFTVEEGRAIEQQIATRLPLEAKSELSVFNWIRNSVVSSIPSIF
jgi:hypothetical protein